MRRVACLMLVGLWLAPVAAQPVDYLKQIKPMLAGRCISCHGALAQKAKLRLDTAAFIRKGGRHGPAILPGNSGESLLIAAVLGQDVPRMPPENEGAALNAEQIGLLKAWIDEGAKAPRNEAVPEDARRHWAFVKPVRPGVPAAGSPDWSQNPIDGFIAAAHAKTGLQPRPRADRASLLRRAYLDLIGLPPTAEQLRAFLSDPAGDAYEKAVDRLLSLPQYGERWGRHWMDIWRYSDWYGRRSVNDWRNSGSTIWRWRDWIVRSLNADKGYDRIVEEMLAADELAPEDEENIVATGYLVRSWYSLNYNQWMRDLVEHTGKAFLGLTLNCAHCHNHKYDPISQEEYFKFRALFEPLQIRVDRVAGEPDPGLLKLGIEMRAPIRSGLVRVMDEKFDAKTYMYRLGDERERIPNRSPVEPGVPAFLGGEQLRIVPVSLPASAAYPALKPFIQHDELSGAEQRVSEASDKLATIAETVTQAKRNLKMADAMAAAGMLLPPATPLRRAKSRADLVRAESAQEVLPLLLASEEAALESVKARIAADRARFPQPAKHFAALAQAANVAERVANLRLATYRHRERVVHLAACKAGGYASAIKQAETDLAEAVKRLDAAIKGLQDKSDRYAPLGPVYPARSTGRRKALAQWIGSRENPLTARVAVNHIWSRHFGRPLVDSVFDFGRNGKRPSHPELLDYLAVDFMDSGWSMKKLHRLIITSRAYQTQSTVATTDSANLTRDPDNRYLWRFDQHRLEAEVIRDSMLFVAGDLDLTLGGPDLAAEEEPQSRRRTLYFTHHPEDGGHLPLMELFDAPDPCECYRRTESLVPQQALALTNSQFAVERGRALARRLWSHRGPLSADETTHEEELIVAAFEQLLTRQPSHAELSACREFLHGQVELYGRTALQQFGGNGNEEPKFRAWESLVRSLLNHNDFITTR